MKKTVLFTLSLLCTMAQGVRAWDGSGTVENPYQIRNSADWQTLAAEVSNGNVAVGTAFRLMGDISITTPVGTSDHRFSGIFDGGGHTITASLSVPSGRTAPFAYVEDATISHLHVDGTIQGGKHTAGITSSVTGTDNRIEDCHVSADITTFIESGIVIAAGIVGHGNTATLTIEGCLFDGTITSTGVIDDSYAGSIVGWCTTPVTNITVKNCIENATYTNIRHAGFSYADDRSAYTVSRTNCYSLNHNWGEVKHGYRIIYLSDTFIPLYAPVKAYSTSGIEASQVGLKQGGTFYAGSGERVVIESSYYFDAGLIGYNFSSGDITVESGDEILTMPAQDVYMSAYHEYEGDGDEAHPYLIENEGDWLQFAYNMADRNYNTSHYLLTNDIEIHLRAGGPMPDGNNYMDICFGGTFDGGGHTINASLDGGEYTAPFYKVDGATIKNLHVAGNISGGIHSSGLVGGIQSTDGHTNLIENCRVSATITCSSTHAGGFVGHAYSSTTTLRGCLFDGRITGNNLTYVGTLVGWCGNNGGGITLQDCADYAAVNAGVFGAQGCKTDLVWEEGATAKCHSAINCYGGSGVGKRTAVVRNGNPALNVTWHLRDGLSAPVEYAVSHLASYGTGLLFDNEVFFVGKDETLLFYPAAKEEFSLIAVTIDAEATLGLAGGGWYSATFTNTVNSRFNIDATIMSSGDFTGDGTEVSPYLISSTAEWTKLSLDLSTGNNTYIGKVFRLTQNIDCGGISVGTDEHPFSGTFDGDGHTLTLNAGSDYNPSPTAVSPFYRVSEATFRHLHTAGKVCTSAQYTGGIISQVFGSKATRLYDCHSSMTVFSTISGDASNGGLVGAASNCDSLVIERCSFTGNLHSNGSATNCGGFIGWSNVPVTIRQSLFDPADLVWYYLVRIGQNFARMADYSKLTIEDCYTTYNFEADGHQGTFVVDELFAPEGGSYEFVGEPDVTFNGRGYYKNGCWIRTTLDANIPFDHWQDGMNGCFISDPWTRNGLHQLKDMNFKPSLGAYTTPIPEAETERTLWGVTYRYLSRRDYHFYISDEYRLAKGWEFESSDADANLIVKDSNGKASEITVITGYRESDYNSDGVQIHNDLVGDWRNHTHLGLIAPHAFRNSQALKSLYFKDTDANNYNALLPFDFTIETGAFENCTNFKELKMMQYTTRDDNHWEAISPDQVTFLADNAFDGCPNLKISVQADKYQGYFASSVWKKHKSRFIIYEATTEDFTVNGVKYHWYRNFDQTEDLKNDESGKEKMLQQIRIWNADYQQFNAASLLDTKDDCNVYYASIIGVDNSDIDNAGGTMRIYNDPGSYYNYKTIVLNRDAIAGNTHIKNIEFWQTNGRSENSFSDLRMVIPNGAFKGCTNLKELRLFYYVQDGDDRWTALGPKDIIPGDNIFGLESVRPDDINKDYDFGSKPKVPQDFKIIVAPELYPDFMDDPNWLPYLGYIEPMEYLPARSDDFTLNGLTYSYMTSPGGIMQTSQVVSQDVSWWTAPRIAIEVALMVATMSSTLAGTTAAQQQAGLQALENSSFSALEQSSSNLTAAQEFKNFVTRTTAALTTAYNTNGPKQIENIVKVIAALNTRKLTDFGLENTATAALLQMWGIVNANGLFVATEESLAKMEEYVLLGCAFNLSQGFANTATQKAVTQLATQKAAYEAVKRAYEAAQKRFFINMAISRQYVNEATMRKVLPSVAGSVSTAGYLASKCWGGSGSYNADLMNKGMRENILSNIHQVGLVGGGYVITTPQKNLVYHTYINNVDDNLTDAVIEAGSWTGTNQSTATMTFARNAFRNKPNLKTIRFKESPCTSNASMSLPLTIPDSAFVGCTSLTEFSTLLQTEGNGTRALGPENFILAGDSIFAGLDSLKFHIVIDPLRKEDFLASESWKPLQRFFKYESAQPAPTESAYGANYAYAYEMNSIKKEHKAQGHLVEHTLVVSADDDFITGHQGAVKLCNDIGVWNNYQIDEVKAEAFKGKLNLRSVSFVDLYGAGAFGDCYSDLQVHIGDRAFQDCANLADLDLLYMVTDGINHIVPMTPQMITIGKDVFKGSPARLKMMPQQVAWFEADDTWAEYKDRFMPCVVRFTDPGIKKALKDMAYYDPANTGTDPAYWEDYCDFARIGGAGFSWLDGKFTAQRENIYSFADFRWFESVGLDYVGNSWFDGCYKMGDIVLPSTIKTIGARAFYGCAALQEIEIPAGVTQIGANAFDGCTSLNTIMVKGDVPAAIGSDAFHKHDNLRIYVPTDKVDEYTTAWSEYARYIQPAATYNLYKEVTVYGVGELASKLGLTLIKENDKVRYIVGPYAKYDSLTVTGPLNGEDVAVLRHMMGANGWESESTDGQLRYLNLWNASLKRDMVNSYNGYGVDEYLEKDNWIGEYMFHNCNSLESVVLPKTVTEIGENAFQEAFGLKRITVGRNTTKYTRDLLQDLPGIEEVVFLTDTPATSESSDPWEAPIGQVYTLTSQLGDYLGDPGLTQQAQAVSSPFSSDDLMWVLADKGHFFPSQYLSLENVENIFSYNTTIKDLDEFDRFRNVKRLENTFTGMSSLETISLPAEIEYISSTAFIGCSKLKTIHISCVGDTVPTLAMDAFISLPADFSILVPKQYCKLYRERWAQYADHINPESTNSDYTEIITVVLTEPNTLAEKLGLTITTDRASEFGGNYVKGIKGDYSQIYKLKVIGPISGADLDVMRYMAGYCPWASTRNYSGRLEYIDLYDADIVESNMGVVGYYKAGSSFYLAENFKLYNIEKNKLPHHAFLRAYNLKTLILPRTCTEVNERALQECEGLETLVIGDDMTTFNWNALDDDAMLTRMYILAKNKVEIDTELALWRWLCNNYNPTFDAFYVRPSLYDQYLMDDAYTGSSWQRTNNVSKGDFNDDESFCVFASHAAATHDDLTGVFSVNGWFDNHTGVRDLTALGFAAIDELRAEDMQKLTRLECVTLPVTLTKIDDNVFSMATNLRYVDMLMIDDDIVSHVKKHGLASLGIDTLKTLVYMPQSYGEARGTNIVVTDSTGMHTEKFRLIDGKDYCVPFAFTADNVENTRVLTDRSAPYTVCLPYDLEIPDNARVYDLNDRDENTLVFTEIVGRKMEAMKPYLIKAKEGQSVSLGTVDVTLPSSTTAFGRQDDTYGYSLRGTLSSISNAEAAEVGAYILQDDGNWHPVLSNSDDQKQAYVQAFRAYLLPSARHNAPQRISIRLENADGEIETFSADDLDGTGRVYDLGGREIDGDAKGIIIKDGKLIFNR